MGTSIDAVAVVRGDRVHHRALKLADRAITEALARAGVAASEVDLLVNAGLYHERNLGEPALAALIQEDVGANPEDPHAGGHGTFSFDVSNGAAGALNALEIVDGFLATGAARCAVVVAGDADPGHRTARDFPYQPGAAAAVCRWRDDGAGLSRLRWLTAPDRAGSRDAVVRFEQGRNVLVVREDPAYAAEAAACGAKVAAEVLADHGLTVEDVALVAAAPFEPAFLDELAGQLGTAPDRVVRPPEGDRLHTAGLLAALAEARRGPGERVLLVGAGAGLSVGAALLTT